MHWEEQRKAMQADMSNKAELARCVPLLTFHFVHCLYIASCWGAA